MHTPSNNTQQPLHQTHTWQSIPTYHYLQSTNNVHELCSTFNNTNAMATKTPVVLANALQQYIKHQPSILGLMEMWHNCMLSDQTTIPLQNMATSLQGNKKAEWSSSLPTAAKPMLPKNYVNQGEMLNSQWPKYWTCTKELDLKN
jgi:hypothetical protein